MVYLRRLGWVLFARCASGCPRDRGTWACVARANFFLQKIYGRATVKRYRLWARLGFAGPEDLFDKTSVSLSAGVNERKRTQTAVPIICVPGLPSVDGFGLLIKKVEWSHSRAKKVMGQARFVRTQTRLLHDFNFFFCGCKGAQTHPTPFSVHLRARTSFCGRVRVCYTSFVVEPQSSERGYGPSVGGLTHSHVTPQLLG